MDLSNVPIQAVQMIKDRKAAVNEVSKIKQICSLDGMMDYLENVIRSCGGDQKCTFLDVGRDFIKLHTRITTKVNLYPVLAESVENPRFHKMVTKILMGVKQIENVRWLPREDGAFLLVSFNLNKVEVTE